MSDRTADGEMTRWHFIESAPLTWTVGLYTPDGKWVPESDHDNAEAAADRARHLNDESVLGTSRDETQADQKVTTGPVIDITRDDLLLLADAFRRLNVEVRYRIITGDGDAAEIDRLRFVSKRSAELEKIVTKAHAHG